MFRFFAPRPSFVYPIQTTPKTAILRRGLRLRRPARWLDVEHQNQLRMFAPASVAGSIAQLRRFAESGLTLTHAVVVFSTNNRLLSDDDREWLWNRFGVPVFEQVLDADGTLLAYECEAHSGLHWMATSPGTETKCGCGAAGLHSRSQIPYLPNPQGVPAISRTTLERDFATPALL